MYQKYFNGMPLYRQERDWKQCGANISRTTFANWIIANAQDFFTPMYACFRKKLLARSFAMADETPVQVLQEPGRRAQTQSYMCLFRSGEDEGPPIILYKYAPTRAGDNAVEFLEGYSGYLIDAIPKGKQLDYTQPSVQGVMYVNRLFEMEDKIRKKHAGDYEAIRKAGLEKEKPVIDGFLSWLEQQKPTRGSRMEKAITYIRNREAYLSRYLEDGRCSFSNNLSENAIRPFVVGRKGWLFSDTPAGAETSAVIYTMVENAKANGVNVYQYLKLILEKQPNNRMSDEELECFTPWNPEVKALLGSRVTDELENG